MTDMPPCPLRKGKERKKEPNSSQLKCVPTRHPKISKPINQPQAIVKTSMSSQEQPPPNRNALVTPLLLAILLLLCCSLLGCRLYCRSQLVPHAPTGSNRHEKAPKPQPPPSCPHEELPCPIGSGRGSLATPGSLLTEPLTSTLSKEVPALALEKKVSPCVHDSTALAIRGRHMVEAVEVLGCREMSREELPHLSGHEPRRHVTKPPQV